MTSRAPFGITGWDPSVYGGNANPASVRRASYDNPNPAPQPAPWQGYQGPQYAQAPMWQAPQMQQYAPQANQWQMQQAQPQRPQSLEQQALGGGSNAQQIQNFMRALSAVGAGRNNTMASTPGAASAAPNPLIGSPAMSNGGYGSVSYSGGFNPQGGGNSYYNMAPMPNSGNPALGSMTAGGFKTDTGLMQGTGGYGGYQVGGQQSPYSGYLRGLTGNLPQNWAQTAMRFNGIQAPPSGQAQAGGSNGGGAQTNFFDRYQPQGGRSSSAWQGQGEQPPSGPHSLMVSDERLKENIEPADKEVSGMLSHLGVHSYEYKNPAHGPGRYVSSMAQELEKTELGKSAVIETREGKMVDYGRLGGVTLAAAAMHERRIAALEKALKLKGGKGG